MLVTKFHWNLLTQAFVKTWNATCNDSDTPTMIIPDGKTFLVHQVTLVGPCKSTNVNFQVNKRHAANEILSAMLHYLNQAKYFSIVT